MSTFFIIWVSTIVFAIISIIFFIIAFFLEKGKYSVIAGLASAIVSFILLFNIDVSEPIIEPLDNEIKIYETDVDVTINSEEQKYFIIYYSLDGTDPKYGSVYEDTITLSESATVCARCKFLWIWSDITKTSYIVKVNESSSNNDDPFVPDYVPGKENIISDSAYQNNQGFFSKQDQMYYFATSTGLYKMNSNFEKCQLIVNDEYAKYLNVLGDWIYYSTFNGIYKIRTDGKYKSLIVQLEGYPLDMVIRYNTVYYIKPDDAKLYFYYLDGGHESCLYDKTVCKLLCTDLYIYFVEAEITKSDVEFSYTPTSLNRMLYDGSDVNTIFKNTYNNDGGITTQAPNDLCEFGNYIVYSNYFGLFTVDQYTDEITELNHNGGYGLCVFNNYAYYSTVEPGINGFLTKVSLDTYKTETFAKPFDDNMLLNCIYPVENKVILTVDLKTWYYLDNNNNLIRITFDTTYESFQNQRR